MKVGWISHRYGAVVELHQTNRHERDNRSRTKKMIELNMLNQGTRKVDTDHDRVNFLCFLLDFIKNGSCWVRQTRMRTGIQDTNM